MIRPGHRCVKPEVNRSSLHHQWLVDVGGSLDVTEGKSLDVGEEYGPVSEVEAFPPSAQPGVGVASSPLAVFEASAAPSSLVLG